MLISKRNFQETIGRIQDRLDEIENKLGNPETVSTFMGNPSIWNASGIFEKLELLEKHLGIKWKKGEKNADGYQKIMPDGE